MSEEELLARIAELEAENEQLRAVAGPKGKYRPACPDSLVQKYGGTYRNVTHAIWIDFPFLERQELMELGTFIRKTCFTGEKKRKKTRGGYSPYCLFTKRLDQFTDEDAERYELILDKMLEVLSKYAMPVETRRTN